MTHDGYNTSELGTKKRGKPGRSWFYGILLLFLAWLLIANHIIFVPDDSALVILNKSSWNLQRSVIGGRSWAEFALDYPDLMSRLLSGQGYLIFGRL